MVTRKTGKITKKILSQTKKSLISLISKKTKSSKLDKYLGYPFLKNSLKLDVPDIKQSAKRLKRQLHIYDNEKQLPAKIRQSNKGKIARLNMGRIQNEIAIIISPWKDFDFINRITDYFTEECRIKCVFKGSKAPLEYWGKNRDSLKTELVKRGKPVTDYWLRELMYERNKPCNNFRVSVCLEVLRMFKPKRWLDISAGWGDRLLSALLYDDLQFYCGVDPNPCLHPLYQKMINEFSGLKSNEKYVLIKDGFETAELPVGVKYDLVFSSPPFFDLEVYSGVESNSYVKYKGVEGWFNGFLMPAIYKAVEHLEKGGYLVLYMGESQGTKYIPKMVELVDKVMVNCGVFYYTDGAKLREFFCWRK